MEVVNKVDSEIKKQFLPYGRQDVTEEDIQAVVRVLRSNWLTQGEAGPAFEKALAARLCAGHAVACSNGTAALHLSMLALGVGPEDIVITSANSFLASANCARYVGAEVRFADIDPETGNMSVPSLGRLLTDDHEHRVKAVIPVHFAGQPADLAHIHEMARSHGARVISDASHAIGAEYRAGDAIHRIGDGLHSDLTVFSFHPVKHVAMGEGGAVTTNSGELAERLRLFRNHGMQKDGLKQDELALDGGGEINPWYYEMHRLGYNYRLTDIQAALGLSQLKRLDWSLQRRSEIACLYDDLIQRHFPDGAVRPLQLKRGRTHAYHLFVVSIDFEHFSVDRASLMRALRAKQIGTQVHYIPIPYQPYYRSLYRLQQGDFTGAEAYYERCLSLPMFPTLTDQDVEWVVESLVSSLTKGGAR